MSHINQGEDYFCDSFANNLLQESLAHQQTTFLEWRVLRAQRALVSEN